ncbi:heavy-metal-associated domain-containing protein [Evtepia sp.]|uniref:heavy-metal-associated domain-containing protein n=1 Tax=Evtepia sp. TaxID=2773933 RepID=UPI002A802D96|nr:cation transporter [Evtepia sp.]MDY4430904.1 cation transporter [Evtepia sp.]
MVKITLEVEGMACGMCESHVNDAVRKTFPVKKVTSSHGKGRTEIIAEEPLEEQALRAAIDAAGYQVRSVKTEPYKKKGFSLFK